MREAEITASEAENYSQLWLQYRPVGDGMRAAYHAVIQQVCCLGDHARLCASIGINALVLNNVSPTFAEIRAK